MVERPELGLQEEWTTALAWLLPATPKYLQPEAWAPSPAVSPEEVMPEAQALRPERFVGLCRALRGRQDPPL